MCVKGGGRWNGAGGACLLRREVEDSPGAFTLVHVGPGGHRHVETLSPLVEPVTCRNLPEPAVLLLHRRAAGLGDVDVHGVIYAHHQEGKVMSSMAARIMHIRDRGKGERNMRNEIL